MQQGWTTSTLKSLDSSRGQLQSGREALYAGSELPTLTEHQSGRQGLQATGQFFKPVVPYAVQASASAMGFSLGLGACQVIGSTVVYFKFVRHLCINVRALPFDFGQRAGCFLLEPIVCIDEGRTLWFAFLPDAQEQRASCLRGDMA